MRGARDARPRTGEEETDHCDEAESDHEDGRVEESQSIISEPVLQGISVDPIQGASSRIHQPIVCTGRGEMRPEFRITHPFLIFCLIDTRIRAVAERKFRTE